MKLALCLPTIEKPHNATLESIERSARVLTDAGIEHSMVCEVGNPYISNARNTMLRKAVTWGADTVVFLDHDLSWDAEDLRTLVQTDGDCVAGTYRYKRGGERYMGSLFSGPSGTPLVREDGCLSAEFIPAGFLKVTVSGVKRFARAYPNLLYGDPLSSHVDLFHHGAHDGVWYGEDYAFSRNWRDAVSPIWVVPDLNITHWRDQEYFPGNLHTFLRKQPGGDLCLKSNSCTQSTDEKSPPLKTKPSPMSPADGSGWMSGLWSGKRRLRRLLIPS